MQNYNDNFSYGFNVIIVSCMWACAINLFIEIHEGKGENLEKQA